MNICKECGTEFFNHYVNKDFNKFKIGDIINNTSAGDRNPIKIKRCYTPYRKRIFKLTEKGLEIMAICYVHIEGYTFNGKFWEKDYESPKSVTQIKENEAWINNTLGWSADSDIIDMQIRLGLMEG